MESCRADTFFLIPDYVTERVRERGGGGGGKRWCENMLSVKQSDPRFDVLIVSCSRCEKVEQKEKANQLLSEPRVLGVV